MWVSDSELQQQSYNTCKKLFASIDITEFTLYAIQVKPKLWKKTLKET